MRFGSYPIPYGNTFEAITEVTLAMDIPLPELTEEVPEKEKTDPAAIFLGILCALLIAGLIVQHLYCPLLAYRSP